MKDVGQELQSLLNKEKYKIADKGLGYSQPTKRDYMIAKYFYELGLKENKDEAPEGMYKTE